MDIVAHALYHSGPGWFNDILDVRVFYDADLEAPSPVPHMLRDPVSGELSVEHHKPLFAGGAPVRGFVRIATPAGRNISHHGVIARLESSLYALEEVHTRDLASEELQLAPLGAVCGVVDLPFEFRSVGGHPLGESFEGALFSIRHRVTVTVVRPWYTFPVACTAPFAVQRVHDIHQPFGGDSGSSVGAAAATAAAAAGGAAAAAAVLDQSALYGPQSLSLEPLADGSTCVFNFDKGWCVHVCGRVNAQGTARGGGGGGGASRVHACLWAAAWGA